MKNTKVSFESGEYTEKEFADILQKMLERFKDRSAQMPEKLLEGLERFHDIWLDNKDTLKEHPAVITVFNDCVQDLAKSYLGSGHLKTLDSDTRTRIRHQTVTFRNNVNNATSLVLSEPVQQTQGDIAKARSIKARKEEPETQAAGSDVMLPSAEHTLSVVVHVHEGGNVFITGNGVQASPSIADIARQGPKPRPGRKKG